MTRRIYTFDFIDYPVTFVVASLSKYLAITPEMKYFNISLA